jgi:SAM-dependent methyltransferase
LYFNDDISDRMMFDFIAESYASSRPGYPHAAMHEVFSRFKCAPKTLEIGSGSGQATADLAARSRHVDCIEPGENFAGYLNSQFANNPETTIYQCDFESFESSESYDLVFSGCALHWIPKEFALRRIKRLLAEDGWLAGIWNQMNVDPGVKDVLQQTLVPASPAFTLPEFADADRERFTSSALEICSEYGFESCFVEIYEERCRMSLDEFIELVMSYSDVRGWDASEIHGVFAGVRRALAAMNLGSIEILKVGVTSTAETPCQCSEERATVANISGGSDVRPGILEQAICN